MSSAARLRALAGLADRPFALGAALFVLIAALKASWLTMPPFWDEAFSIFPAGHWLATHGFDWPGLLAQPGWDDGGPNVHGRSVMVLVIAVVVKLVGAPERAWPVLHLVTWALAAAGLTAFVRVARRVLEPGPALACGLAALLWPLFNAQLGQMYLELPIFAFTALAALAAVRGQFVLAALGLVLATWAKEAGVIYAGALAASVLFARAPLLTRLGRAALLAGPAAAFALSGIGHAPKGERLAATWAGRVSIAWNNAYDYWLIDVKDLVVLLALGAIAGVALLVRRGLRLRAPLPEGAPSPLPAEPAVMAAASVVFLVVFHFLVYPQVSTILPIFLPRYAVAAIPWLWLTFALSLQELRVPSRFIAGALAAVAVVGLLNREGLLYGEPRRRCPAVAERSEEYFDAYLTYREGLRDGLAQVPEDAVIYAGLAEWRLLASPELGYTTKRYTQLVRANQGWPPWDADPLYIVMGYPNLGGEAVTATIQRLRKDPARTVELLYKIERGDFRLGVLVARKKPPPG